jgi:hypothetical protein
VLGQGRDDPYGVASGLEQGCGDPSVAGLEQGCGGQPGFGGVGVHLLSSGGEECFFGGSGFLSPFPFAEPLLESLSSLPSLPLGAPLAVFLACVFGMIGGSLGAVGLAPSPFPNESGVSKDPEVLNGIGIPMLMTLPSRCTD